MPNTTAARIQARFLNRLVCNARGRVFLLNFLLSTEESDEASIFDTLVSRVDDPELGKLVSRHRADEEKHAGIFRNAVERAGGTPTSVPAELRVVERLDRRLGSWADAFLVGSVGVMEMYALLLVIEERAVREWPVIAAALRPFDAESAADIDRVVADEARHVKYAHAISRRYAPNEQTLERTIAHVRVAEQAVFNEHSDSFMRIILEEKLLEVGRVEHFVWRGISMLGSARMAA